MLNGGVDWLIVDWGVDWLIVLDWGVDWGVDGFISGWVRWSLGVGLCVWGLKGWKWLNGELIAYLWTKWGSMGSDLQYRTKMGIEAWTSFVSIEISPQGVHSDRDGVVRAPRFTSVLIHWGSVWCNGVVVLWAEPSFYTQTSLIYC